MRKVLGEDGVEWGIEEVDGGGGLFLVAAFNWEESLGPVAVCLHARAVLPALPHAWDKKGSWLDVHHRSWYSMGKHEGRHRRSSLADWALQGIEGRDECGLCVIGRRRCGNTGGWRVLLDSPQLGG